MTHITVQNVPVRGLNPVHLSPVKLNVIFMFVLVTGLFKPGLAVSDSSHIPQPWRAEAVTEGREVDYNLDWFLQQYSYQHIQSHPDVTENGLRGTGGSISSNELFFDFRYRQNLNFQEDKHSFLLDIQRSEDFDGAYDRQLVGFRYSALERLEFWLQGDVFADKSLSDVYFSTRYSFDNVIEEAGNLLFSAKHWLHLSLIIPDAYFNKKTDSDDRFIKPPRTLFLQWRRYSETSAARTASLFSLNYSPSSSFDSQVAMTEVENESLRGAAQYKIRTNEWEALLNLDVEWTERQFWLYGNPSEATDFKRRAITATSSLKFLNFSAVPEVGLHYFSLREQGYFGRQSDQQGIVDRKEPLVFLGGSYLLTDRQKLKPKLYIGHAKINQSFSSELWRDRREDKLISKVVFPWQLILSEKDNAVMTVSASYNLHDNSFGGGNLQLHWPL